MSRDVKWVIGMIVAAIIAIGIAAVAVSVTVLQINRIATGMRHHEHRTNASNTQTILALQTLVDGMRDDYRDGMHGVEDVLHELQQIRQRLQDKDEDEDRETLRRELERASSNVEQALTVSMLFRPVRTSDVTRRLEEIRDELKALRRHLDRTEESDDDGGNGADGDGEGGADGDGEGGADGDGEGGADGDGEGGADGDGEGGADGDGEGGADGDGEGGADGDGKGRSDDGGDASEGAAEGVDRL